MRVHSRAELAIRATYALCLAVGTYNHALPLILHGWLWTYGGRAPGTVLFWTSLTVLDPITAGLLFVKPRLGCLLLVAVMVADVAHNGWLLLTCRCMVAWMVVNQGLFLLVVLAKVRFVWKENATLPAAIELPPVI